MEKTQIHPLQHFKEKKYSHKEMCQTQNMRKQRKTRVISDPVPSLYKDLTLLIVH